MCLPSTSPTQQPFDFSAATTQPSWLPPDALSQSSYAYARSNLRPLIFAHSCRAYLYALFLAQRELSIWAESPRLPLLLTTALFHDMGTSAVHDDPVRFEVAGADAAVAHLSNLNMSREDLQSVWTAIAVHTSPHIAERIDSLARLIRLAVLIDFKSPDAMSLIDLKEIAAVEEGLPRGPIEKLLSDTVVEQAIRQPEKGPAATWVGNMKKSHLREPEYKGVNREL